MEINDIFPVSLKYLQHTNRIITSKDYIKQDEKKKINEKWSVGSQMSVRLLEGSVSTWDTYWYLVGWQHGKVPGTFSPRCYDSVVA